MQGNDFIRSLERVLKTTGNTEMSKVLGKSAGQVATMRGKEMSALTMARIVAAQHRQILQGGAMVDELKRRFREDAERDLARMLGTTQQTFANWRKRKAGLDARQVSDLLKKTRTEAVRKAHAEAFRPIIEFYPIAKVAKGRSGAAFSVFEAQRSQQRTGLKQELERASGLYVFYDARGKCLYVGKAEKQALWPEMHSAFNRSRTAQTIAVVRHPVRDVAFRPADEKVRQPVDTARKLHELAAYFSAYEVTDALISSFEALFIRAFPNDLLNFRMEKIARPSKSAAPARKRTAARKKPVRRARAAVGARKVA